MNWINALLAPDRGAVAPADPCDETVTNEALYDPYEATRTSAESSLARLDAQIADEIKRRQMVLMTRYILAVRAR